MAVDIRFTITAEDRAKYPAEFISDISTWQARQFYGARIDSLLARLSPENAELFLGMSYPQQCLIIGGLIQKGTII